MNGLLGNIARETASGQRSARETIESTLRTLQEHDAPLRSVTRLLEDRALAAADATDRAVRDGSPTGPLAGVPFGVKDLFDVKGLPTTAGSAVLRDAPPAARDATVIERLCKAGAIPVATLNMDEFAYGFATDNAHYGVTRNPRDTTRLAGGSSGGSAATVAAGFLPLTLGSDTNGSIRVPASLCGIWGLRPTQGALPLTGVYPFSASLDMIGPFADGPEDLRLAFSVLSGTKEEPPASLKGLRVARLDGWFRQDLDPALEAGLEALAAFFGPPKTYTLPEADRARAAAFVITAAEGGNLHLPRLKTQPELYDPATRDRLMAGALLPASPVIQAHRLRRWFRSRMHEAFAQTDILIAPATTGVAPRIDEPTIMLGGKPVSARANLGLFTQPLTLAGMPVLSAPLRTPGPHGLPLGVQLIARPGAESLLFAAAIALRDAGLLGFTART
ncbi:AtzE family amidohydrolase [Acetobacter sp. AN02]|uniref:AtzE family amidohydrolase n=1 Tax=Acetobacter sp. AN02 TaxID=2894186 RepID=UPI0024345E48|nr:AtzE family amidohydrolase [Acetobacter sp. AN02]MDG6094767.1 AtzE family amidohydrolase [Acetobacter sp. AN02]